LKVSTNAIKTINKNGIMATIKKAQSKGFLQNI
jgi:ribosomal protein L28